MKHDAGKWAEAQAADWLKVTSANHSDFAYHRFPDARAARSALAAQPSDFLVIHKGIACFLEVKETAQAMRFSRSKISQYGSLLKMHYAEAEILVLVYRSEQRDWVMFMNQELFGEETPTSFAFAGKESFAFAGLALGSYFG